MEYGVCTRARDVMVKHSKVTAQIWSSRHCCFRALKKTLFAGLVLAGPLIAVVGAVGAGALATQSTKAGDVARASGDVVISAGERAKKIDEKHHVVDKTKKASKDLYTKAKTFEGKHHLGAKAGKSLTNGLKFVSSKLKPKDKSNTW